jgi:hypothetical protein
MRRIISLLVGAGLLATLPAYAAPRLTGEAKLAKIIEGRVAGKPVDCVNLRGIRSSQIIDKTAIVYDAGSTIYVNRPRAGAEDLDDRDALVTKTHSPQLCSIDVVHLYDTAARFQRGFVYLGEFVPYKKVR